MAHPSDDELEALAQRLELVAPTDVEVVDMLRACKGRDAEKQAYIKGTQSGWDAAIEAAAKKAERRFEQCERDNTPPCYLRKCAIGNVLRACKTGDAPDHAELVSTLSAAILDAQIRALETRKLDTPDQIRASAWDFLARLKKGPSHD